MKLLLSLALLVSASVFAEEAAKEATKVDSKKEAKMAREAYKKAKAACLAEDKELKGKNLKDCIVKKQTEAK